MLQVLFPLAADPCLGSPTIHKLATNVKQARTIYSFLSQHYAKGVTGCVPELTPKVRVWVWVL